MSTTMPTYKYRPAKTGVPKLRSRSNKRARLWAGGTYFRALDSGVGGNSISVELIGEIGKPGQLIVTNHTPNPDENVVGPVDVVFLEHKLKSNEYIVIDQLTTTPRATIYSISLQIRKAVELGPVSLSGVIHIPPYISARLTPRASEITPTSTITIKPRTKTYDLAVVQKTIEGSVDPETGSAQSSTESGYDPAELRTKVNEAKLWIEMVERSGTGRPGSGNTGSAGGLPNPAAADVNDQGVDDNFLSLFPETYLEGGDGLTANPTAEYTGPTRTIVHVNRGERENGELGEVNVLYEWDGSAWKQY